MSTSVTKAFVALIIVGVHSVKSTLPENFLVHHIASSFVNTVSWWISNKMKDSPEKITEYFLTTIQSLV